MCSDGRSEFVRNEHLGSLFANYPSQVQPGLECATVRTNDGTFDLFLNSKLDRSAVAEQFLNDELCVRFGFCGEEYETILRDLKQNGRAELRF